VRVSNSITCSSTTISPSRHSREKEVELRPKWPRPSGGRPGPADGALALPGPQGEVPGPFVRAHELCTQTYRRTGTFGLVTHAVEVRRNATVVENDVNAP